MAKREKNQPEPIRNLTRKACRRLKGIFTDIDDTVSLHGKIPAAAYKALWDAKATGLRVIPVTGRPAGWVDHIARMWPVDAVVGENGAFYFYLDPKVGRDGKLVQRFLQSREERTKNFQRLDSLFQSLKKKLPRLEVASDQQYRAIDIALDFCEDVSPRFSDADIQTMVDHYRDAGANAKVSSIHVNAWFGNFDKYSTCKLMLKELYQEDLASEGENYLYLGDSPNDEPFFERFPLTVGVANVSDFLDQMKFRPRYITRKSGGEGFAEAIRHILAARK